MNRVHIIGGKNHGKTTLIVELVKALTAQGLRVGTIKHTHHHHELDTPGKDSHRHRDAGAAVVGICSRAMNAVFWPPETERENRDNDGDNKYLVFASMFEKCHLILVEGDSKTSAPKLEVWRSEIGTTPLAKSDESISAVITDSLQVEDLATPLWPRQDVAALAQNILSLSPSEK